MEVRHLQHQTATSHAQQGIAAHQLRCKRRLQMAVIVRAYPFQQTTALSVRHPLLLTSTLIEKMQIIQILSTIEGNYVIKIQV